VLCGTGPKKIVEDDYSVCWVKASGGGGVKGYSYIRGTHIFTEQGPRLE